VIALALPAEVLAHPPTETTREDRKPLIEAMTSFNRIWGPMYERSFGPMEARSHTLPITPEEAAVFLLDLGHAIQGLDEIAAEAEDLASSHVPWFRTIQYDANEASYWYQRAHREVQRIVAQRYGFQGRVGVLRGATRQANLAMGRLLETFLGFAECYPGWFRLPDGTCWRGAFHS